MTRRLRVAYLLGNLHPGGAERQMLMLAERLPKDEFAVDFVLMDGPGTYDDWARGAGAGLVLLRGAPRSERSARGRLQDRARLGRNLLRTLQGNRYDIVDAWLYPADIVAAFARPLTRTPVVVSGRRNLGAHARFGPLSGVIDRLAYRLTDAVVANSQAAADHAVQCHHTDPARLHVIRNGVLPSPAVDPPTRGRMRRELGAGEDDTLIACVGNFGPVKRQDQLVEAFAQIATRFPSARLVLVGSGEKQGDVEQQVQELGLHDRIRIHGPLLEPRPYYRAFDIVAQTSESEGLPNVLLEAAAAGRPIVATAAGGSSEIIDHGETGLLVPVGDVDGIAAGLARLMKEPALRSRLGRAAEAYALKAFAVDTMVAAFADLYRDLTAKR